MMHQYQMLDQIQGATAIRVDDDQKEAAPTLTSILINNDGLESNLNDNGNDEQIVATTTVTTISINDDTSA